MSSRIGPWLYIGGWAGVENDHSRYLVAVQLRDFLNGGRAPAWLGECDRTSEECLLFADDMLITAVGPMVDANPPACQWVESQTLVDQADRARLIDKLYFAKGGMK